MNKEIKEKIIEYLKDFKKSKRFTARTVKNMFGLEEEETQEMFDVLMNEIRELNQIIIQLENDL